MNDPVKTLDEDAVMAVTVEGEDLTFNAIDPEATDVQPDVTWFEILDAAVGK